MPLEMTVTVRSGRVDRAEQHGDGIGDTGIVIFQNRCHALARPPLPLNGSSGTSVSPAGDNVR